MVLVIAFFLKGTLLWAQDPTNYRNNLGLAYARYGLLEEAIMEWKGVLRLNPHYPETHYNLGLAYYLKGQYEDALQAYKKAIE
ncbi:MAG TPA: tetratricopeptide repeat protein, partial [Candidatus Hypogeohydataceae bacterium YC38]